MKFKALFLSMGLVLAGSGFAAEKTTIHIGVQAMGTVEWELAALQQDPKTAEASFKVAVHPVANAEAAKIALQSGTVDMIVSDWIWVSRMRGNSIDFTFYPYSNTSGALMVPEKSPINKLADLKGKSLGVAGGELDKNWLLLQALGDKENLDLDKAVTKTFAAPPLINEQLKQNRIDAALNYWHFAAALETHGYRQIIDGPGILKGLGITQPVPVLGYVFKHSWAEAHKPALLEFFKATAQAKNTLCTVDASWQQIIPLTKVEDAATQAKLRQRYCEGRVEGWGTAQQEAAEKIYALLQKTSKSQLTGTAPKLQPGTIWSAQ